MVYALDCDILEIDREYEFTGGNDIYKASNRDMGDIAEFEKEKKNR